MTEITYTFKDVLLIGFILFAVGLWLPLHYFRHYLRKGKTLSFKHGPAIGQETRKFLVTHYMTSLACMALILMAVTVYRNFM